MIRPEEVTIVFSGPRRKLTVAAEMDGYAEFLEELRAWTPEAIRTRTDSLNVVEWLILSAGIALGAGYFAVLRIWLQR